MKVIKISNCHECPYCGNIWDTGSHRCTKFGLIFDDDKIIQSQCKLTDGVENESYY